MAIVKHQKSTKRELIFLVISNFVIFLNFHIKILSKFSQRHNQQRPFHSHPFIIFINFFGQFNSEMIE